MTTEDRLLPELRNLAIPLTEVKLLTGNPRRGDVEAVAKSLDRFGQRKPIVITGDGTVIAGNHTVMAARELMWSHIAAVKVNDDEATAKAFALADNRTQQLGGFDDTDLAAMLAEVSAADPELLAAASYTEADLAKLLGETAGGEDHEDFQLGPSLADRFLIPPFSVLDARQGWWRKRKAAWMRVGLRSEVGREDLLAFNSVSSNPDYYDQKNAIESKLGRKVDHDEFREKFYKATNRAAEANGTSVFDPVLCELIYRWFTPPGGLVLDPWAGGSVRGIMAALLGRDYYGIELRDEQVKANIEQARKVMGAQGIEERTPRWHLGDSLRELPKLHEENKGQATADLLIGCPPYYDLETYGEDPRDLSNMSNEEFDAAYAQTIKHAAAMLRNDRFAVLTVSSVRKKQRGGPLRDLRGVTVRACEDAGLQLYNEACLITIAGSLPIRTGKMFVGSRALGRSHQDVLVFVKGNAKRATDACGDVDIEAMSEALAKYAGEPTDDDAAGDDDMLVDLI